MWRREATRTRAWPRTGRSLQRRSPSGQPISTTMHRSSPIRDPPSASPTMRIAAVADLHCTKGSQGTLQPWLSRIAERADILVLCGDLTDYGLPEEAQVLGKELAVVRLPILAVLGNH